MTAIAENTRLFREHAAAAGFGRCGFAAAGELTSEARHLEAWLDKGCHGQMHWMSEHFEKRIDPRRLVPGTRSVVVLSHSYPAAEADISLVPPRISKYAAGRDYHKVLKKKMKLMLDSLKAEIGDFQARYFVDSAPVMERSWALRAGLGWQGKNALLISPREGSFFFLGIILTDLTFEYDHPLGVEHCGTCNRCIEACPTDAIMSPGVIDARRCISYLTIELKGAIPEAFRSKMEGWAFGCDTCQDVCPHNHSSLSIPPPADRLQRRAPEDRKMADWLNLDEAAFAGMFNGTPVRRAGYEQLRRNILFISNADQASQD